ncbi:MAG: hypothetical protein ACT4QG_02375 [Sporichthyaceae bacterium]
MAFRLEHPFNGAIYTALADGTVEVAGRDGRTGVFDMRGSWMSGSLRSADPELIRWVGTNGYTPASRHLAGFSKDEM